jgi:glycosyltransferase involved in cell wall biosynthesis
MYMAESKIEVSIVLPCYNGGELLRVQLESIAIQEHDEPWELLFLDNASTDGSADVAREFEGRIPNLRIIDASAERGQPYALNLGIKLANGQRIIACDADDEVAPGWLRAMSLALKEHRFAVCRMDFAKLNPPWLRSSQQYDVLPLLWYHPRLAYAAGATLGFQKSLYEEIGPFDSSLPYLHDTEFCIQAQLRGVPIILVKDAVLHYRRRTSLKAHYKQSRNYAAYNTILAKRYAPDDTGHSHQWSVYIKEWMRIMAMLPRIRSIRTRYDIAWLIGQQAGRLDGVFKHGGILV